MARASEDIDLLEGELADALPVVLAPLQSTPSPHKVHAALVIGRMPKRKLLSFELEVFVPCMILGTGLAPTML